MKIFKDIVFRPMCENATGAIVDEIQKQRNGEIMIDIDLVKDTVDIYHKLSSGNLAKDGFLPLKHLDKAILDQTEQFYSAKSQEIME